MSKITVIFSEMPEAFRAGQAEMTKHMGPLFSRGTQVIGGVFIVGGIVYGRPGLTSAGMGILIADTALKILAGFGRRGRSGPAP